MSNRQGFYAHEVVGVSKIDTLNMVKKSRQSLFFLAGKGKCNTVAAAFIDKVFEEFGTGHGSP